MTCNTACKNNNPGFHSKGNSKKNLSLACLCLYWILYTDEAIWFRITDKILSQPKQQLTTPLWILHRSLWALATFPCNVDFTFIKTKKQYTHYFSIEFYYVSIWNKLLGAGAAGTGIRRRKIQQRDSMLSSHRPKWKVKKNVTWSAREMWFFCWASDESAWNFS